MAMVEFCKDCDREHAIASGGPLGQRIHRSTIANSVVMRSGRRRYYIADHHGKQCRYGKCTRHCKCSRAAKRAWLNAVTTAPTRRTCTSCRRHTNHVCVVLHRGSTNNYAGNQYNLSAQTHCGKCCEQCRAQTPCSVDNFACCTSCGVIDNSLRFGEYARCISCRGLHSCVGCAVLINPDGHEYPVVGWCSSCNRCGVGTNEDGEPYRRTPQTCCECSSSNLRPQPGRVQLHTIGIYMGHLNLPPQVSRYNPLKRSIGVEMEVAGFNRPPKGSLAKLYNTCVKWHTAIGTDGSIRSDHNNGVEIRTSPAHGNRFVMQLRDVTKAIRLSNGYVNESCGLHVHVGLQDFVARGSAARMQAQGSILALWLQLEDTFYKLVKASRAENNYCQRLGEKPAGTMHQGWLKLGTEWDSVWYYRNVVDSATRTRYSGLNLTAVDKYKTVEFRLHEGTIDDKIIVPWALLLCSFVETCLNTQDPRALYKFVEEITGPAQFLYNIAPTDAVREYLANKLPSLRTSAPIVKRAIIRRAARKRRAA